MFQFPGGKHEGNEAGPGGSILGIFRGHPFCPESRAKLPAPRIGTQILPYGHK